MKTLAISLLFSICSFSSCYGDGSMLSELLKEALFAEEADRDLTRAEEGYREILRRFDSERAYAATAALRLGDKVLALAGGADNQELAHLQKMLTESPDLLNATVGGETPIAAKKSFGAVALLLLEGRRARSRAQPPRVPQATPSRTSGRRVVLRRKSSR